MEKPDYFVQFMFLPGKNGEIADESTMAKVDSIGQYALSKLQEFLNDFDNQTPHTQLVYHRSQWDKEDEREPDALKFLVFVEDINEDGSNDHSIELKSLEAFATGYRAEIHIPKQQLEILPEGELNVAALGPNEKKVFEWLLCHILHEILHMLGAFHHDTGIMSGTIRLFDEDSDDFQLISVLDDITARIVSENLVLEVPEQPPFLKYVFDSSAGKLSFESTVEMMTIVFLNQTYYTNKFYFTQEKTFEVGVPENWDAVVVNFAFGGSYYYKNSSIFRNGQCDRIRLR